MYGIGYFQNNFFFLILGNFAGGFFLEEFFRRNFLGGFFEEEFFVYIGIDLFVNILVFVNILSQSTRKEEEFKSLEVRCKLIALKNRNVNCQ